MKTFLLWNYKTQPFGWEIAKLFSFYFLILLWKHLAFKLQPKIINLKVILNSVIFKIQFTTLENYYSDLPWTFYKS